MAKDKVTNRIERIQRELDTLKKLLVDENVGPVVDLIMTCFELDDQYKRWCEDYFDDGADIYETGVSMGFETEAQLVHDISLAARKIRDTMHPPSPDCGKEDDDESNH